MDDNNESMKQEYSRCTYRKLVFIAVCIGLVFILFFVSLCVGTRQLTVEEVFGLFFDHIRGNISDDPMVKYDDHIVWDFRVPRAIFAIVAGIALSIGGASRILRRRNRKLRRDFQCNSVRDGAYRPHSDDGTVLPQIPCHTDIGGSRGFLHVQFVHILADGFD